MADIENLFDRFIDNISLGEPQVSRMNSAANTISGFLCDRLDLASSDVFLQGSYPNGTAVEPVEGGEYDIDIVCVSADGDTSADQALQDLGALFKSDGRFAERVVPKKPCVRLEYAEDEVGKFHVDVVPVRPGRTAPLEAPRKGAGWHDTAPAEYTDWCRQQGEPFARTVKVFKRWRDEQQTVRNAIKSIVLQVLVSQHMPLELMSDADRIAATFQRMLSDLHGRPSAPEVINPVLQTENLARHWTDASFQEFVTELEEAVQVTSAAQGASDPIEAADHWRTLLGEDFPSESPTNLGFAVSDYSHAHDFSMMSWSEGLDPRYGVTVSLRLERGRSRKRTTKTVAEDQLIFAGSNLHFRAHVRAPNHVEVWWQVANTGEHARVSGGLRGEIFHGRDLHRRPTQDQADNWERTSYTGVHLIRAILVRDRRVVALSAWRRVQIYSRGHRFGL